MAYIQRLRRGGLSFAGEIYHFDLPESPAKPLVKISFLRSALPEKELTVSEPVNPKLTRYPPGTGGTGETSIIFFFGEMVRNATQSPWNGNNRQLPFLHNRFFVDWPRGAFLRLGVT